MIYGLKKLIKISFPKNKKLKYFILNNNNIKNISIMEQTMQHVQTIEKRIGWDVESPNIEPVNGEGCVGKGGIDKSYTLEMVIDLASKIPEKPNVIVRTGKKSKWYLKKIELNDIDRKRRPASWSNIENYTMYIIKWE